MKSKMHWFVLAGLLFGGAWLSAVPAHADDGGSGVTLEPAGVALTSIFKQTSAGMLLTPQGKTLTTMFAPIYSWHCLSLDAGAALDVASTKGSPFGALDITAPEGVILLPLKIGAGLTWFWPTHEILYGLHVSVKL